MSGRGAPDGLAGSIEATNDDRVVATNPAGRCDYIAWLARWSTTECQGRGIIAKVERRIVAAIQLSRAKVCICYPGYREQANDLNAMQDYGDAEARDRDE